jgi:hypothetical protein
MWDALKNFLGLKKSDTVRQDALAKMGIFIVKDERVEQRVRELADFYVYRDAVVALKEKAEAGLMTPEECLSNLIVNINMLNKQIDRIATPYWRALSDHNAGVVMRAWSEIVGYFFDVSYTLQNWFRRLQTAENQARNGNGETQLSMLLPVRPRLPKNVLISAFLTMVIREYLPRAETLVRVSWTETDVTPSWAGAIQPIVQPQMGYGIPPMRQYDAGSPSEQAEQPYGNVPAVMRHRKEEEEGE